MYAAPSKSEVHPKKKIREGGEGEGGWGGGGGSQRPVYLPHDSMWISFIK